MFGRDNINRSDGDWVELPPSFTAQLGLSGPAVYVVWISGDQVRTSPPNCHPLLPSVDAQAWVYRWEQVVLGFGAQGIVNASQDEWLQSFF